MRWLFYFFTYWSNDDDILYWRVCSKSYQANLKFPVLRQFLRLHEFLNRPLFSQERLTIQSIRICYLSFFLWRYDPTRVMASSFLRFLDHTQRLTIVGRTPLDEWSARRRDLYLTTHDTHNRRISMPPVGFEPKISAGERPQAARLLRSLVAWGLNRNPHI